MWHKTNLFYKLIILGIGYSSRKITDSRIKERTIETRASEDWNLTVKYGKDTLCFYFCSCLASFDRMALSKWQLSTVSHASWWATLAIKKSFSNIWTVSLRWGFSLTYHDHMIHVKPIIACRWIRHWLVYTKFCTHHCILSETKIL